MLRRYRLVLIPVLLGLGFACLPPGLFHADKNDAANTRHPRLRERGKTYNFTLHWNTMKVGDVILKGNRVGVESCYYPRFKIRIPAQEGRIRTLTLSNLHATCDLVVSEQRDVPGLTDPNIVKASLTVQHPVAESRNVIPIVKSWRGLMTQTQDSSNYLSFIQTTSPIQFQSSVTSILYFTWDGIGVTDLDDGGGLVSGHPYSDGPWFSEAYTNDNYTAYAEVWADVAVSSSWTEWYEGWVMAIGDFLGNKDCDQYGEGSLPNTLITQCA